MIRIFVSNININVDDCKREMKNVMNYVNEGLISCK